MVERNSQEGPGGRVLCLSPTTPEPNSLPDSGLSGKLSEGWGREPHNSQVGEGLGGGKSPF